MSDPAPESTLQRVLDVLKAAPGPEPVYRIAQIMGHTMVSYVQAAIDLGVKRGVVVKVTDDSMLQPSYRIATNDEVRESPPTPPRVRMERAVEELAQGLRKSHCARGDNATHECVGRMTVTRTGVDLECAPCGSDRQPIAPSELLPETKIAKGVLASVGFDWYALTPEAQRDAVAVVRAHLKR